MLRNNENIRKPNSEANGRNSVYKRIIPYWIFAIVRVVLTILPQTGYIHPDEYFQSIEVIAGDHFDIDIYKPWEFNVTFPLRTALIPQIAVGVPYSMINIIAPYYLHLFGKSLRNPYALVIFPRLMMCALSFVSDYCLYKICCIYSQNYIVRLITYASSYVMIVYATRTFSNTIELVLTSLLLYYVARCMAFSEKIVLQSDHFGERYEKAQTIGERVKYYKLRASLPYHSLNHCLVIATITVFGIFNRPTFIVFAFPPIFFWLHRGLGSRSVGFFDFHIRIFTFILACAPTAIFLVIVDSFYYGYITIAEIMSLKIGIDNFVVTPVNFLKYNLDNNNLRSHGLHPRFTHFLVNVPLLFNVLGIIGLYTFGKMIYCIFRGRWLDLPRIQSIDGLMTASFIVPIAGLSLIPHQEPRFIIPVLLPLVFLHARTIGISSKNAAVIYTNKNATGRVPASKPKKNDKLTKLQYLWIVCNLCLTFFYGFAHQGGVLPLASHIAKELRGKPHLTHVHLYTSYTYSMPTALLQLRNTKRTYTSSDHHKYRLNQDFYLYEQGDEEISKIYENLARTLRESEEKYATKKIPYRVYYALPLTFYRQFASYNSTDGPSLSFHRVCAFYPHVTTEKLPSFEKFSDCLVLGQDTQACLINFGENLFTHISEFYQNFGLLLLRIENPKVEKHFPALD